MSTQEPASSDRPAVTAVLTSCGRHDLLQQTLDSFLTFNTYPLERVLVVEDGPEIPSGVRDRYPRPLFEWLATDTRSGQIVACDLAYRHVTTEYIFHIEDDWEFFRPGFIEASMPILQEHSDCVLVWIRSTSDTQGHTVEPGVYSSGTSLWRRMMLDYDMNGVFWHGFTFNPGLRRLSDYAAIGGRYGLHTQFDFLVPWTHENDIAKLYRARGFFAAILADHGGAGYVRHLGRGRRVKAPEDTKQVRF